jgi:hypothetical protein
VGVVAVVRVAARVYDTRGIERGSGLESRADRAARRSASGTQPGSAACRTIRHWTQTTTELSQMTSASCLADRDSRDTPFARRPLDVR